MPYRVAPPKPPDPFIAAWGRYRKRRVLLWLVVCALPVVLFPDAIASGILGLPSNWPIVAELSLGSLFYLLIRELGRFECPRCGKPFHSGEVGSMGHAQANRCAHCGIPVGMPKYS